MNNDINFVPPDDDPDESGLNEYESLDGGSDYAETENGGLSDGAELSGAEKTGIDREPERHRFVMPERFSITGLFGAFRDYWNGLRLRTKVIFTSSAAALLLFAVILTVALNRSPWVIAYSGLDDKEIGEIVAYLQTAGVPHEADPLFKTVSVKERDKTRIIGVLAMQGYPKSGVIFEEEPGGGIFESNAEKADRIKRNRERRLEAIFSGITGVESASVGIVIPDNTLNVLRSEYIPSSAAVMLRLRPGFTFTQEAIRGLENMLQKYVEGLQPDEISIIDGSGVRLNENIADSPANRFASVVEIKDDYERRKSKEIYNSVVSMLTAVFGADGVRVGVAVESDFDELITEAKNYYGVNVNEETLEARGILSGRTVDRIITSGDPDNLGYAAADLNPETDGYYETLGDPSEGIYSEELHYMDDFLVDYVFTQSQRSHPKLTNISISALVDSEELESEDEEYWILNLAMASGINELAKKTMTEDMDFIEHLRTYISIYATPFPEVYTGDAPRGIEDGLRMFRMLMILGAAVIVIIILVICIIAILARKSREREIAEEQEAAELAAETMGLAPPGFTISPLGMAAGQYAAAAGKADDMPDEASIEAREESLKRQIKLFADKNPDVAAQLIRTLIKGDELPSG